MRLFSISIFFLCTLTLTAFSQQKQAVSTSEILQEIKKLNTIGTVLYIAAHPDDENTRLLTYLCKEKKLRTGYLSITRGDGGQNLIGKEQGDLLGLIRTQELLAARSIDGAEQFFTRANDFGYSKTPEETMSIWNKDSILSDMVWCIRKFKPDVIICRFPTTGEGGHGHHTASALLAVEAFDAAANSKKFPEQLKYTQTWQAKRIFWNTFNFGSTNTTSPDQIKLDVGLFNPLIGKSYGEIAAESRSMHKSQGFGSAKGRGSTIEYFKQLKGDSVRKDLFENLKLSWNRYPITNKLTATIEAIIKNFDVSYPQNSIGSLVDLYKNLKNLPEDNDEVKHWKKLKLKETQSIILTCAGLWAEINASDYTGIPGNNAELNCQIIARNPTLVTLAKIKWPSGKDTTTALILKTNELYSFKTKDVLSASLPYSNPYWLNSPHEEGMFTVKNRNLIGIPFNPSLVNALLNIQINGIEFQMEIPVSYKYTDPVKGEVYRSFEIIPPATVTPAEKVYMFCSKEDKKKIRYTLKANTDSVTGIFKTNQPAGWKIEVNNSQFKLDKKGDETIIEILVSATENKNALLTASLQINQQSYSKSITRIEYDHIPYQFLLQEADVQLIKADIKKTGNNIGYIPGAGDAIPSCLEQIGYTVTVLTDEMLLNVPLSSFDAIVTGIRAYNTNERLAAYHTKLMDYVKNGGNLIVQYNTNSRIGPLRSKIGPYPFTISRNRVTNEKAEVRFSQPTHPALNFPNKIELTDFEGWKQERGIYFADEADANYQSILSMNDTNEKPMDGSLIIGKYGKGNFAYTGLVFFRELPAGVTGAYRLFANLLSLPKNE